MISVGNETNQTSEVQAYSSEVKFQEHCGDNVTGNFTLVSDCSIFHSGILDLENGAKMQKGSCFLASLASI